MIEINDFETWPDNIKQYLATHTDFLKKYCSKDLSYRKSEVLAPLYDQFLRGLKSVLAPYQIHGYHCTRLTQNEINIIVEHGMQLPNYSLLSSRIKRLIDDRLLSESEGQQLMSTNEADDPYRANMLWFCFFRPSIAGEHGIGEFFTYWGGEALFNSQDAILKASIQKIGIPSIIEASLPIKGFDFIELNFANKYKHYLGIESHSEDYEGSILLPLLSTNILNIFTFPCKEFVDLSGCDKWERSLK